MNIAIIFAGGVGSRMGKTDKPKQFLEVDSIPIMIHTLMKFEKCESIDYISIACVKEYIPFLKELLKKHNITKVRWISEGGATGQLSIFNAIKAVHDDNEIKGNPLLLMHDAVRPNIDIKLIEDNIVMAREKGNSVTVCSAIETIFVSENKSDIDYIMNRDNIFHAKAPQCFFMNEIYSAHINAIKENDVNNWDSCSLMFKNNTKLFFVIGKSSNIKITTIEDFYLFKTMYYLDKDKRE